MTRRTAATVAWGIVAVSLALYVASLALGLTREPVRAVGETETAAQDLVFLGAFVLFAVAGALIVSRQPRNVIGWLFVALGSLQALNGFVFEYAVRVLFIAPGSLPLGREAAWLGGWVWGTTIVVLIFLLLLFPDGRLPSLFSKVVAWATVAASAVAVAGAVLLWPHRGATLLGGGDLPGTGIGRAVAEIGFGLLLPLAAVAIVAVVIRFIRSRGEERLQLKWFAFAAGLLGVDLVLSELDLVPRAALPAIDMVAILSIPVAVAIAVLKYRLYDIDLVISKTLVYGALAAFITAVYVGVVVGVGSLLGTRGEPNLGLQIAATALVAVAFQPARSRVQRLANRLVYGKRASPYEALAALSRNVAETYATEDVLERMARVVAEGTGARVVGVWLRVGEELHPAASWPADEDLGDPVPVADPPAIEEADRTFPAREGGQLIGALTLSKTAGDPLRPGEEALTEDLASQAGLVLRNVRLTAELQRRLGEISRRAEQLHASRRRIVAAQDRERRRLERDIHDGAQQHLVALAVNVNLARSLITKDPQRARPSVEALERAAGDALATLRDLAGGIYPPVLEAEGLAEALRAQTAGSPIPVEVRAEGLGRKPEEVEAAAYFSVLEALQNTAKYAGASRAVVELGIVDGHLSFEVTDDGRGFDPSTTPRGSGLQNMADRLAVLGGSVEVTSSPGRGTRVTGRIPVPKRRGPI